jgi:chemotaxis protein MotA
MKNFIVGLFLVMSVLLGTMLHSKSALLSYLNVEGLVVVIGGTIAISILNSRFHDLLFLIKRFLSLLNTQDDKFRIRQTLLSVTKQLEKGVAPVPTGQPVIDRALEWISLGLKGEELDRLLSEMVQVQLERYYSSASVLQNLSKYPPALGMIGTVIGIVAIFQGLSNPGGQESLGANLSVAMASTLYGLVLANFFINPIAELFTQSILKKEEELQLIVETAKMWAAQMSSIYIQEHIEIYDAA